MVRVAGVDPGTGSMDVLVYDDDTGRILYEEAVPRARVTADPSIVYSLVESLTLEYGLEAITAPSGYGIPLKRAQLASTAEICEATFVHCRDLEETHQIHGLRRLMLMFKDSDLPAYFTPGVIHLPSVPEYRKAGRIDIGTADKVYTVAAALAVLKSRGLKPRDVNAIVVEAGKAYTSAILVEAGEIVDGIGGTMAWWGWTGHGFIDMETCYILSTLRPQMPKRYLFQGGASHIAPESLQHRVASEAIAKTVAPLLAVGRPDYVVLSGRLFRGADSAVHAEMLNTLLSRLSSKPRTLLLEEETPATVKAGAYGAAIIASGIAGGKHSDIIEALRLWESRGSVFDHLTPWGVSGEARRYFSSCLRAG
ncbi:MAG: DUF1464 family protein [Desulfurococcales archaeon]|nr:DUF1464 family protein [Desulfurococcales archaeon]